MFPTRFSIATRSEVSSLMLLQEQWDLLPDVPQYDHIVLPHGAVMRFVLNRNKEQNIVQTQDANIIVRQILSLFD